MREIDHRKAKRLSSEDPLIGELITIEPEAKVLINAHPFRAQVLARAVDIALTRRGSGLVTEMDAKDAMEGFPYPIGPGIRLAGLLYAIGGAILSVALSAMVASLNSIGIIDQAPFLFIALGGLLLIILAWVDENV